MLPIGIATETYWARAHSRRGRGVVDSDGHQIVDGPAQPTGLRIHEIWRYPVKSLGGESLTAAEITPIGIEGDRGWGIEHLATGMILTARRRPELLFASARYHDGEVTITLPDGRETTDDDDLSAWLGDDVALRRARADQGGTFEAPLDNEADNPPDWVAWTGPAGAFHDSARTRVSLVSTGSIGAWDRRRFRANVVVDDTGEDALIGHEIRIGGAVLAVVKPIDRCVMVTRPQPGLDRDLSVLRTIRDDRDMMLAIGALVSAPGAIKVGDSVELR